MFPQSYLNFDIALQAVDHRYAVRVRSPAGEASGKFALPFSATDIQQLPAQLDTLAKLEAFGSQLFTTLFTGELLTLFRRSHEQALRLQGGLRLSLQFENSPILAQLPWEYLYDPGRASFLGLSETTPIVRFLALPQPVRLRHVQSPLRILILMANPAQLPPLDSDRESRAIDQALRESELRDQFELQTHGAVQLSTLQELLLRHNPAIVHFSGHGRFDENSQEGMIYLTDQAGVAVAVTGRQLGVLLQDLTSVRLLVLNAGETGRTLPTHFYRGVAQSLLQQGVPTVIAMQFPINDTLAFTFSRAFYTALANHTPQEVALTRARKAIYAQGDHVGWGAPVLLTRAPGDQLWAEEPPAAAGETSAEKPTFWQKLGLRTQRKS